MAEITIEVDDKGNIGTLPEPLQKYFDKQFGEAFKKGAAKVENELKPRLRSEADEEKLKTLEAENNRFKEDEARRKGEHEEAERLRNERHAAELKDREDKIADATQQIARRQDRLRTMLGAEVRAAAVAAGARAESLPELEKLLGADLDLDDDLLPFVKGTDGKPKVDKDNKPISIEGFVTQYLADHPHHIAKPGGKPGRAQGGLHMGGGAAPGSKDEALAAAAENPNAQNVNTAIRAIRSKAS